MKKVVWNGGWASIQFICRRLEAPYKMCNASFTFSGNDLSFEINYYDCFLQFAGFSADALAERIADSKCKVLVTVDSVYRGEKMIHLKEICDNGMLLEIFSLQYLRMYPTLFTFFNELI